MKDKVDLKKEIWNAVGLIIVVMILIGTAIFVQILISNDHDTILHLIQDDISQTPYYGDRFYDQALADFLQLQLLMYPFNGTDIVTLEFGGIHNELIYINHTVPNPDYSFNRDIFNYIMHFDYELTFEENKELT